MAVSDVYGLDCFATYMQGLEDCYTVIGGTACDILMRDADLDFRATKDIDLVLLVENRLPEVAAAVWNLVKDGGYRCGWRNSNKVHFYRFTEPQVEGFPVMLEIFSKAPSFLEEPEGLTIAPLPVGEDLSSLSAILLDDNYYEFMKTGRKTVHGIAVLDAARLVPFKAKAYIDLSTRKAKGEHVNTGDLKKHKKDVFRLLQLFTADESVQLTQTIRNDMRQFRDRALEEGVPLQQMGVPLSLDEAVALLETTYGL